MLAKTEDANQANGFGCILLLLLAVHFLDLVENGLPTFAKSTRVDSSPKIGRDFGSVLDKLIPIRERA
jgi:hypothetical protein